MLFKTFLLPGVVIPSLFAAIFLLLTARLGKQDSERGLGAGLAIAAAFLSASVAITGWPHWPPVGSSEKLVYLTALAATLGVATLWIRKGSVAWSVRGALTAFLLFRLLSPPIENTWSRGQAALWLTGLFLAAMTALWAWSKSLRSATEAGELWSAAVRLALMGGIALSLGLSESARLAQLAGAVACGALVVELFALVSKRRSWRAQDSLALSSVLSGLLIIGHLYAGLEPIPAILLFVAILLLALPPRSMGARLAPLLPLAIALGLVIQAAMSKPEDPYDYYSRLSAPTATSVTD